MKLNLSFATYIYIIWFANNDYYSLRIATLISALSAINVWNVLITIFVIRFFCGLVFSNDQYFFNLVFTKWLMFTLQSICDNKKSSSSYFNILFQPEHIFVKLCVDDSSSSVDYMSHSMSFGTGTMEIELLCAQLAVLDGMMLFKQG